MWQLTVLVFSLLMGFSYAIIVSSTESTDIVSVSAREKRNSTQQGTQPRRPGKVGYYGSILKRDEVDSKFRRNGVTNSPTPPFGGSAPQYIPGKASHMDYPVKTTRRFVDTNGNVRVITTYGNKNDNPLPIYEEEFRMNPKTDKPKTKYRKRVYHSRKPLGDGSIEGRQYKELATPSKKPSVRTEEYSSSRRIKFPDDRGELYERNHQSRTEGETASRYNKMSSTRREPLNPEPATEKLGVSVPVVTATEAKYVSSLPLQTSGSSIDGGYVSEDIDDGFEEGNDGSNSYGGGGYGGNKGGHVNQGYESSNGDKGNKGYKTKETYDKGKSEKHGHEEKKGQSSEESGDKKGHLDESNRYAEGHRKTKGKNGEEKGHSKGHRKGHKAKGFHTVHHKDEYKKDEVFYDEEHDTGHEKKHGQNVNEHKDEEGGNLQKGHLDSGYQEGHKGFKGDKGQGHFYDNQKGHKGNVGQTSHYGHQSNYGKKSGYSDGGHGNSYGGYY